MADFSMPNSILISWLYILLVCIRVSSFFVLFFIYCKYYHVIHIHKVINNFLRFCKFVVLSKFPEYIIEWHHFYNVVRVGLPVRCLFGFFPLLGFVFLLSILPSSFPSHFEVYDLIGYFVHFKHSIIPFPPFFSFFEDVLVHFTASQAISLLSYAVV